MHIPGELASELLATTRYGASSVLLAQASGGNNSVKSRARDVLWVKASGKRLADVTGSDGTVALRCSALQQIITHRKLDAIASRRERHEEAVRLTQQAVLEHDKGRPSLETLFHALLSDVVLHLHPVYLNAFACMEHGRELLSEITPREFGWVKYAAPGWELARELYQLLDRDAGSHHCACFVLENHGFIASAENARQIISATDSFLQAAQTFFGDISRTLSTPQPTTPTQAQAAGTLRALIRERWGLEELVVRPAPLGVFHVLDTSPQCFEYPGALVPDDVVYGCSHMHRCSLSSLRDLVAELPNYAPEKLAISVEGTGTLLVARNEPLASALEELLAAHILIRMLVARRGKLRLLPTAEVNYLQSMESEKYRVKVCASGAS